MNPNSGLNRRRPGLADSLRKWAHEAGLDAEIRPTDRPGHAREIAAGFKGEFDFVVAVGGDGTMNEVACGAIEAGLPMGIIPCGSGNGLARHLRIPMNHREAMHVLATGGVRTIDSGIANGHRFFTAMGVGFDAEIARRFNELPSRGLRSYLRVGIRLYLDYRPELFRVSAGTGDFEIRPMFISIANSDQLGNNARIAPGARADDGVLDLVALQPSGILSSAGMALRMFTGSLDRARGVTRIPGTRFQIERSAGGVIHVDGETRVTGPVVDVQILPRSLGVIAPA